MRIETKTSQETKKVASILAKKAVGHQGRQARIFALEGNLGSGKTTFVQGFARALGIREKIQSPTFVLMKIYKLRQVTRDKRHGIRHLIHIDCYRTDSPKDLLHLGFKDLLKDKDAIILIEWADRIKKLIPPNVIWLKFSHGKSPSERIISVREGKEI